MINVFDFLKQLQDGGNDRFRSFALERFNFTGMYSVRSKGPFCFESPVAESNRHSDKSKLIDENAALFYLRTAYWDWQNQAQQVVAFSINDGPFIGLKKGLRDRVLKEIDAALESVPGCEVQCDHSGRGRQVLVYLDEPVQVTTLDKSRLLSQEVIDLLEKQTGFPFYDYSAFCWPMVMLYAVKAPETAFKIVKPASGTFAISNLLSWKWKSAARGKEGLVIVES